MKLCIDCRWMREDDTRCDHPTSIVQPEANLVTGVRTPAYHYSCAFLRTVLTFNNLCGKEGLHWEAKDARPVGFV